MALFKEVLEREAIPGLAQLEKFIETARSPRESGRPRRARARGFLPFISVIIPAHNEENYLGRTLEALAVQQYNRYEVIVVANGCTDRTAAVARGRCDRLIVIPDKCLGRARNEGARAARGELLLFLDADTLLESDALAIIADRFTPDCASGTLKGVPDSPKMGYRSLFFFKNQIHRWQLHQGSVGVILCWKAGFEAAGAFDEALEVRENSDLIRRLGRWGKYRYIGETPAVTSMRRYERAGGWRTAWLWIKLWVESWFVSLRHRRYETIR